MTIYRIEHRKSKPKKWKVYGGPYGVSGICDAFEWQTRSHAGGKHPCPEADPLLQKKLLKCRWEGSFHCGFDSMKQLTKWFSKKELNNLKNLGFFIVSYEAKKILQGETQILFIPKGRRKILKTLTKKA